MQQLKGFSIPKSWLFAPHEVRYAGYHATYGRTSALKDAAGESIYFLKSHVLAPFPCYYGARDGVRGIL